MARFSLAALQALDRSAVNRLWMMTGDVARTLRLSVEGVKWLTRTGELPCERTVSGQRLFRRDVVFRVLEARAQASVRQRGAVLRAAHLRLVHRQTEPRQLELFTAHGGVAPAAARAAEGRKGTTGSGRERWPMSRQTGGDLIRPIPSTHESRKVMAKVEQAHDRRDRRAAGRR